MKTLKSLIINFIIISFVYGQNLILKSEIEKQNYLTGEPIYVLAELINNDNKPIYHLPFHFIYNVGGLDLFVRDSMGNKIECSLCFKADVPDAKYIKLSPGESAVTYTGILWNYGKLNPGKYSMGLKYRYLYYDEKNKVKTEKYFFSDPKEFYVNNPVDSLNISVAAELKAIEKIYHTNETDEIINPLIEFTKKYSNTVYVFNAYDLLLRKLNFKRDVRYEEYGEILLSKYPNSFALCFLLPNKVKDKLLSDSIYQSKVKDKRIIETIMKIKDYQKKEYETHMNKSK